MSKYTTQLRSICETKANAFSNNNLSVDEVIEKSWNKIFTDKFPIFDENYRKELCCKILKHYYTYEICSETVGLWIMWLNEKMETIMPYYNQLYKSQLLTFNPFYDVDVKRTSNRKNNGNQENTNNSETEESGNVNANVWDYVNDTPQGGIDGIETLKYLTSAENNKSNQDETRKQKITQDGKTEITNNEDYFETVLGKQGTQSYSDLLIKFRETFLNVDMLVIEDCKDLFFGLW